MGLVSPFLEHGVELHSIEFQSLLRIHRALYTAGGKC